MGPVHRALLVAAAVTLASSPRGGREAPTLAPIASAVELVWRDQRRGLWSLAEARRLVRAHCPAAVSGLPADPERGAGERWELLEVGRTCRLSRRLLPGRRLLALGLPVDLNRASALDLAAVPGLGPATARRLVALRERAGPFDSLDQLVDAGIGRRRLDRLEPYLTVGRADAAPPSTAPSGPRSPTKNLP